MVRWKKSVNMPITLGGAATTSGPVQVEIAHGIDYVGVRRRYPSACVHPILPDRENIVTLSKCCFRAIANADDIESRQHRLIGENGALIEKFITKCFRFSLRQPVSVIDLLDERRG
jgi:hypothetical protein